MQPTIKIGVSSCLMGETVRFDGGHKHDRYITGTLGKYFTFVPVCPETECGLKVPREAMRLVGVVDNPRLVTNKTGIDHTERMQTWAAKRLDALDEWQSIVDDLRRRYPGRKVLMRMLEAL